jgi:hypothetical protein
VSLKAFSIRSASPPPAAEIDFLACALAASSSSFSSSSFLPFVSSSLGSTSQLASSISGSGCPWRAKAEARVAVQRATRSTKPCTSKSLSFEKEQKRQKESEERVSID